MMEEMPIAELKTDIEQCMHCQLVILGKHVIDFPTYIVLCQYTVKTVVISASDSIELGEIIKEMGRYM